VRLTIPTVDEAVKMQDVASYEGMMRNRGYEARSDTGTKKEKDLSVSSIRTTPKKG